MSLLHRLLFPNESKKLSELQERIIVLEASFMKVVTVVNCTTSALEKISHHITSQELEKEHTSSRSVYSARQHKKDYIN